ncbi:uncharacterized protein LOC129219392 [Uloborus diversus]|uniref:uncharacterized protein LOC129219392 n=1 Tax=Uloborus diversus TaxID=327109 RepID=UPI00240A9BF8|nr:uncharacterized protein LOC129219392 [Uloborus diversus]
MFFIRNIIYLMITVFLPLHESVLLNPIVEKKNASHLSIRGAKNPSSQGLPMDFDLTLNDAQESANFFTSDIGNPFDSPSDYGAIFDNFPNLPYFPEFGEIFRISRTTTPQPPFHFPDYVRDPFPDRPPENPAKPLPPSIGDSTASSFSDSVSGGRRPSRRPPRPASSGTRTKVSKQNQSEPREKPKVAKTKPPNKARDYPKIFKFTSDRVNLAEFDMKKKMNENYLTLAKGDDLDSDKVKRNKFLILHGGVFEIERSGGRPTLFHASTNIHPTIASPEETFLTDEHKETRLESSPYFYKI